MQYSIVQCRRLPQELKSTVHGWLSGTVGYIYGEMLPGTVENWQTGNKHLPTDAVIKCSGSGSEMQETTQNNSNNGKRKDGHYLVYACKISAMLGRRTEPCFCHLDSKAARNRSEQERTLRKNQTLKLDFYNWDLLCESDCHIQIPRHPNKLGQKLA